MTHGEGAAISNADVRAGIQRLNNHWRNNDVGNGVDMEIEFALAVQDEYGNCTNGINHVDMSGVPAYVEHGVKSSDDDLSGIHEYDLKKYSIWDPEKYYNIWLINKCPGFNGWAKFALDHGKAYDGAVLLTSIYLEESSSTWAHEMGHALNLFTHI